MYEYSFQAMGTDCLVVLDGCDEAVGDTAAEAAIGEVARLETKYSRYDEASFLSRINRVCGAGGVVELDEETRFFLTYAEEAWRISEGAFDVTSGVLRHVWRDGNTAATIEALRGPTMRRVGFEKLIRAGTSLHFGVPGMEIDLGGIVKEHAADRAAAACRARGATGGLVDLGGDIAVVGPRADGAAWSIAVGDPGGAGVPVATLSLRSGGVATSGDYERHVVVDGRRMGHILDARTGLPAEGAASVTVVADTALVAGTLATLAILRGRDGRAWLEARGVDHVVIDAAHGPPPSRWLPAAVRKGVIRR